MRTRRVPYYCSWESPELVPAFLSGTIGGADDPRWRRSGAATPEQYEFWAWRACGMACLRMILADRGLTVPPMVPLAEECLRHGGYVRRGARVDGLIYAPFATWVRARFGLPADVRPTLLLADLAAAVTGGALAMASVHPSIRTPDAIPPHRGGHLVLVTGVTDGSLVFNNPSGVPGASQHAAEVPLATFARFFAGRGVVFPCRRS